MLVDFFPAVVPEKPSLLRMGCMEANGVKFMIAHHGTGMSRIAHVPDDMQGFPDPWSPVDEIAHENRVPSLRMAVHAGLAPVSQHLQESFKGIGMAVNVAY
jgi:hypothetical protein